MSKDTESVSQRDTLKRVSKQKGSSSSTYKNKTKNQTVGSNDKKYIAKRDHLIFVLSFCEQYVDFTCAGRTAVPFGYAL